MLRFTTIFSVVLFLLAAVRGIAQEQPASSEEAIGEVFASTASVADGHGTGQNQQPGRLQYSSGGTPIYSGSTVDAGATPAIVRLGRGGEVRVCPRTSVAIRASGGGAGQAAADATQTANLSAVQSVNQSANQHLLLSLDTGSLEINYSLGASADSIVTPDFRIVVAGPGDFRLAVGADARGDSCVRTFAGNSAAILISELMGDGSYQLKPNDSVSFHGGRVSDFSAGAGDCGCPAAPPAVLTAESAPPKSVPASPAPSAAEIQASAGPQVVPAQSLLPAGTSAEAAAPPAADSSAPPVTQVPEATPPTPVANPGEVHVQVEAPVIFQAAAPEPDASSVEDLPAAGFALPLPQVSPPAARHHGFFGKLRGFFAAMFGR